MLQIIIDWILYAVIGLDSSNRYIQMLNYFIYDSVKILLLLALMIFIIGVLRTYISQNNIRKWLSGKNTFFAHISASVFGAITPFCSCSSIPIFLSFLRAGVPLGVTFSFLITSPILNEYLVVLMWGFFGWKIALAYVVSGIIIGVFAGWILGKLNLEKHLEKDFKITKTIKEKKYFSFKQRLVYGLNESKSIVLKVWLWVLLGVFIGALIHNFVPESFIHETINAGGIFTVPIAVLLGVPLYGSCAAIVPIAVVLFEKGVLLGTSLAFMMAVSALSLPEAIILRRAMNIRLILIYFAIVTLSIIVIGYLFNILQPLLT